jgi:uncharacterized protein YjbI with pentapeptide repeats
VVVLGLVVAVFLATFLLKWAPELLAKKGLSARDEAEDLGRIRTALLAMVAGLIAVVGAVFTGLSYRLNRAGQITERFTRAIDQLGSRELDVRLGGIYALERIARDSADDHPQVVEVLTAYVRGHAAWQPAADGDERQRIPRLPTDVQAAMSVLGRRDPTRDRPEIALDLTNTDLRRLRLLGEQVHLEGVQLFGAHLEGAVLVEAHLDGAYLSHAHLEGASLADVSLDSAELQEAHLDGVLLNVANLAHADFTGASLQGADLTAADLTGSTLSRVNFDGAVLDGTQLAGAWLIGAQLKGAAVSDVGMRGAIYDDATTWPDGFDFKAAGARRAEADMEEFGAVLRPS